MIKPRRGEEWIANSVMWSAVILVIVLLLWLCGDVLWHGLGQLSWTFLTTAPRNAGRMGGIAPILVSTALIIGVALGAAIPLGIGAAILLSEFSLPGSWVERSLRLSLDVLAGVPSIVFGLFGNAFFCKTLGLGFSILSGGLTLACMVLPILIRATQAGLQAVPEDYRRSAAALGISRRAILFQVLLPMAMPGVVVGLLLGFGRAIAETAALIFTSGYVDRMPESLMDSGRALSVHIFDLSMNISGGEASAYGSALVLLMVLGIINSLVAWIGDQLRRVYILDI